RLDGQYSGDRAALRRPPRGGSLDRQLRRGPQRFLAARHRRLDLLDGRRRPARRGEPPAVTGPVRFPAGGAGLLPDALSWQSRRWHAYRPRRIPAPAISPPPGALLGIPGA